MAFGTLGSTLNDELNRLANGGTYRDKDDMVDEALAAKQWANRENIVPYSTDTVGVLNEIAALGPNRQNWFDFNGVCNYLAGTTGLPAAAALRQITTTGDILTSLAAFYVDANDSQLGGGYLYLPGVALNYASAPDSAALDITGDIDLRVKVALDDWTPSAQQVLLAKSNSVGSQRSYALIVTTSGTLQLLTYTDGATALTNTSTVGIGITDGTTKWVRVTLDVDNGASGNTATFFTSDDGTTWTQLGSPVVNAGVTSILNSTSPVEIGSRSIGNIDFAKGKFFRAQVLNGINGTVAFNANFETGMTSQTVTSFTESSANAATVTINRTTYNFQLDTLPNLGNAGSLLPVTVGSSTAADSNDAKFLAHDGTNYVYLPGTITNYLEVPDSAALDISGDIDLRWYGALDDWTPAVQNELLAKQTLSNRSYKIAINSTGFVTFQWSTDGSTMITATSSVATGVTDGTAKWVRATLDVDNGASGNDVKFYLSDNGSTWTQLGATVTNAGVTSLYVGTAPVRIGAIPDIGTTPLIGKIYRAQIYSDITETNKVLDVDTSVITSGADTYVVPTTYTGQAGAYFTGSGLSLNGVAGNYVSTPDSTPLDITGDIDVQVKVAMTDWTPSAVNYLVGKYNSSNISYALRVDSAGTLGWVYSTNGTATTVRTSTVATGITDGATKWVRITHDVDNGASGNDVKFFLSDDGSTWTQLGTTITNAGTVSFFSGTAALEVGSIFAGTTGPAAGTFYEAIVKSGIDGYPVFDADFTQVPANALRMTESSINKAVVTLATTRYAAISRSSSGRKTVAVTQPTWLFGTDDYMEVNNRYMAHSTSDENYVYLSGASGNYMSVSDNPPLDVTADLDLRAKISLDNWATGGSQTIVSKRTSIGNQRSYRMVVSGTGGIFLELSSDGTATTIISSTTITSFAAGATKWIRATFDSDNGAGGNTTKFFTSDDGTTWTQLGADVVNSGVFTIYSGTAAVELGSCNGGLTDRATGKIYRGQILSGINGTTVLDANAAVIALPSQTTFTDSSSNAYTVTINKSGVGTFVSTGNYLYLPGVASNNASAPDSAALSITGDIDIRCKVAADDWTPSTGAYFLSKAASGADSYTFYMSSGGNLGFDWTNSSAVTTSKASSVPNTFVDGTTKWVRVTLDVDNGASGSDVIFYTSNDGISWTQLGTTQTTAGITNIRDTTATLWVGEYRGTSVPLRGKFFRAQVYNGIGGTLAFDANFEGSITSLNQASFTESSSNAATVTINRSGSTYRSAGVIDAGYLYPGATNTFANSTIDYLNFGATDSFTALIVSRQANYTATQFLMSKTFGLTTPGYFLRNATGTPAALAAGFNDATVQVGLPGGSRANLELVTASSVRNTSTDTGVAYKNATAGTTITDTTTGSLANVITLQVGRVGDGGSYADMELYAAAVFRQALTATQIRQISNYFANREAYL